MKFYLLIIILLSTVLLFPNSPSHYPIDSTTTWRINHVRNWILDENEHEPGDDIYKYFINGDTLINSKNYYKIYKTGTSYLNGPFYYENIYQGALRDSANQFLYIKKNETSEILLYDFNVKVGDTIMVPYDGVLEEKKVSSIDSLPDGRRIVHFNPDEPIIGCGDQYYIEGIGGNGGLLEGPACGHVYTYDYHLVCFVQNDELIYHDYNYQFNCDILNNQGTDKTLDSTGVWRVNKQADTDSASSFEKLNYFFSGDTVINGKSYLKLHKSGFGLFIDGDGQYVSGFFDKLYVGGLRADNNKLYYIEKEGESPELLFNFNLNEGDINDGLIFRGDTIKIIDTILDNRKAFYLQDNTWGNKIMEGIGTDQGLIEKSSDNSYLICYSSGNSSLYITGSGADCVMDNSFNELNECNKSKIIPKNPTTKDYVKLVTRSCYEVSNEHPSIPILVNKTFLEDGSILNLDYYYNYDTKSNLDLSQILVPVFDTLSLGYLSEGNHSINQHIHTIYNNGTNVDTSFNERMNYLFFTVKTANDLPDKLVKVNYKIYPVPAKNYIIIENPSTDNRIYNIEIFTILGSKVETFKPVNNDEMMTNIDISNLKTGIYLLTIHSNNCSITNKIMIR